MKNIFFRFAGLFFLLCCGYFSPAQEKAQPIIDNGFLSYQGWAGAIHPSGNYVIRADRSVIHAYDRKNRMLFQTYTAPCIAELIRFTADGKYMIVQTGGEIGSDCYRALVYDFYTGALLLNEVGMHINNAGPDNLFYLLKTFDPEQQYAHKELLVYDLGKSIKPIRIIQDSITLEYTSLFDKKTGDIWHNIHGHYTLEEIKAGKIRTTGANDITTEEKEDIDSLVSANGIVLDVKYYKEQSVAGVFDEADFRLIAGPFLLSGNSSGVYISRLDNNTEVAMLDTVMIFGYNYLEEQQKLILKARAGDGPAVAIDLKTGAITKVPTQERFYHHALYENDSTAYTVYVNDSYITINKYYTSNPKDPILYKSFAHGLNYWDLFVQGNYYTHLDRKHKLVLHNNGVLIDLNDFSVNLFDTKYDTTLVHPAIVRFSPGDSSMLMINEWKWNHQQASQFEKNTGKQNLVKLTNAEKEQLVTPFNLKDEFRRYFANSQKIFNYAIISNPFLGHTEPGSPGNNRGIEANLHTFLSSPGNSFIRTFRDSLLVAEDDTNLVFARLIKPKEIIAHEKAFKNFVNKHYSEKNLYQFNNQFPSFLFYASYYSTGYRYKKMCEPIKGHEAEFYYQLFCSGKEGYTKSLQEMEKKFAANLVRPVLTYDPLTGQPVYGINILNTSNVPDLSYAGILPENDIYFHDIVLPMINNRRIKLNYAHGIFELQETNGKTITRSSLFNNGEFIHVTPDGYYFASKNRLKRISIRLQNKVYPIEQFDLKYNRPDIVLARLGCRDAATLDSYHKAYLKRLKKMGFTEAMLKDDFHLPEIEIENREKIPDNTKSDQIELNLNIRDTRYPIDRINVWINDVPVFGTAGINLRDKNTRQTSQLLTLELCRGKNKIEVSVLNQAGAESYRSSVLVTSRADEKNKPDLYLVTIGDSKYQDTRYDLSFAAKDAQDIGNTFKENTRKTYNNVYTYTVTDEEVTRDRIATLKKELAKARRDDVVLVTVAGHGVLDKNYNYYLATYHMDFTEPEKHGLPYEELENLLDGIAPLRKTLLIDACHSGEVDKDEVEALTAQNTSADNGIKFRTAGAGIRKKNLGLKTSSELMGELFTDLRKGTGATVISSASGVEYAMESEEWKNGLFTYCLLHGLKNLAADTNQDGEIWLSELQQYLRTEVTRLSNGKQQPTSRMENMSMDFRLW